MNIPTYWIRERRMIEGRRIRLRGISADSQQDARERMEARARLWQQLLTAPAGSVPVEAFRAELRRLDGEASPYSSAILEPIEQQPDADNIITRNRYGSLVLNSISLCFVDVDRFRCGFWASLFGGKIREEQALLEAVRRECAADCTLSARVYRTAHGWRVMLRGEGLSIGSAREAELFSALQADPLYAELCRKQLCWRARLSPKPFYRGLKRYPLAQSSAHRPEEWIAAYEKATAGLAVCRLLDSFGPPLHDAIVELHDTFTLARKCDLELA